MAGTGKRADHKKSLIIKLYEMIIFGKQGITSRGTEKDRSLVMNLREIESNFDSLMKKFGKNNELDLSEYKILGEGELSKKITIKALAFSSSAKEKLEKSGSKIIALGEEKEKAFAEKKSKRKEEI